MRTAIWGVVLLAASGATGCIQNQGPGLDDRFKLSYSGLLVPGACPANGDSSVLDLSAMLLDSHDALLPDSHIRGQYEPVGDLLTERNFAFVPPSGVEPAELAGKEAIVESDPQAAELLRRPIGLTPTGLRFLWNGGEDRKDDDRLVILLMDQSGSLIGQDPNTGNIDTSRASDLDDARILFMRELVGDLPEGDFVSLVPFNGSFPTFDPEYASPGRNHDIIDQGLGMLERGRGPDGGTPLVDALDQTLSRIIDFPDNADLNPVVVLFTDGTEGGDTTPSGETLAQVTAMYAQHRPAPVPVIVLHLQVPATAALPPTSDRRGRDPDLQALACATGGEYLFLRDATELTANPDLPIIVRNRLTGTWRLRVAAGLGALPPHAGYLLTAELSATLGKSTNSAPIELSTDATGGEDTRLWLYRP